MLRFFRPTHLPQCHSHCTWFAMTVQDLCEVSSFLLSFVPECAGNWRVQMAFHTLSPWKLKQQTIYCFLRISLLVTDTVHSEDENILQHLLHLFILFLFSTVFFCSFQIQISDFRADNNQNKTKRDNSNKWKQILINAWHILRDDKEDEGEGRRKKTRGRRRRKRMTRREEEEWRKMRKVTEYH